MGRIRLGQGPLFSQRQGLPHNRRGHISRSPKQHRPIAFPVTETEHTVGAQTPSEAIWPGRLLAGSHRPAVLPDSLRTDTQSTDFALEYVPIADKLTDDEDGLAPCTLKGRVGDQSRTWPMNIHDRLRIPLLLLLTTSSFLLLALTTS